MKRVAIILAIVGLLLMPIAVSASSDVKVVSKTGDGTWVGNTWQVGVYPAEVKSTTITLCNFSSGSLDVKVSVLPTSLDSDNLTFELSKSAFIMPYNSYTDIVLSVQASGSTTPGIYTAELKIGWETPASVSSEGGGVGGEITSPSVSSSSDGKVDLVIPFGTIIRTVTGQQIYSHSLLVTPITSPPSAPQNTSMVGLAYNFEPSGVTFDSPITLTFKYSDSDIPKGVDEGSLTVAYYNETISKWIELAGCVVDSVTNTVTVHVSHFTRYTILAKLPAIPPSLVPPAVPEPVVSPVPTPPEVTPPPVVAPIPEQPAVPIIPVLQPSGFRGWIIVGVIVLVGVAVFTCWKVLNRKRIS